MYRSDMQLPPEWLNEALYRVFASESKILQRFSLPIGASILIVARDGSRTGER